MDFAISKNTLGSERDLVVSDDLFSWTDNHSGLWTLGHDNTKSIKIISDALNQKIDISPGEKWENMWRQIPNTNTYPMWSNMIPVNEYKEFVSRVVAESRMLLDSVNDTYYTNEFLIARELILTLEKAKINEIKYHMLLDKNTNRKASVFESFAPDAQGFAKKPVYSQTSTVTGRLTVTSGPNILTLNKEYRDIIISKYPGGKILNVDFVSLEPRILYSINNGIAPNDIYGAVKDMVFKNEVSRNTIKTATMGSMYGISNRKFASMIDEKDIIKASDVLRTVREFFGVGILGSKLKRENS